MVFYQCLLTYYCFRYLSLRQSNPPVSTRSRTSINLYMVGVTSLDDFHFLRMSSIWPYISLWYRTIVSFIELIETPSSAPSCMAQLPMFLVRSFNASSSGIRCSRSYACSTNIYIFKVRRRILSAKICFGQIWFQKLNVHDLTFFSLETSQLRFWIT